MKLALKYKRTYAVEISYLQAMLQCLLKVYGMRSLQSVLFMIIFKEIGLYLPDSNNRLITYVKIRTKEADN